jgi:hypothetical protein
MKIFKFSILTVLVLAIYSCGPVVNTSKPTNANLNNYQTFSYLPNAAIEMPTENFSTETVNSMVIQQINDKMMDAGYKLDRDKPDLLVLVSTKINQETETDTEPIYARYGAYNRPNLRVNNYYNNYYFNGYDTYNTVIGYDTDTYTYKEGSLIIQLVDRDTRKTVWKGISNTDIYRSNSTAALTNLVNAIFEEYPLMQN